jgi:hypothetical protein
VLWTILVSNFHHDPRRNRVCLWQMWLSIVCRIVVGMMPRLWQLGRSHSIRFHWAAVPRTTSRYDPNKCFTLRAEYRPLCPRICVRSDGNILVGRSMQTHSDMWRIPESLAVLRKDLCALVAPWPPIVTDQSCYRAVRIILDCRRNGRRRKRLP